MNRLFSAISASFAVEDKDRITTKNTKNTKDLVRLHLHRVIS
jgi:hypothetical protein